MSLIRQLWIAVVVMMTLAFVSSFLISTHKAKSYFEEQLLLKNIDNANSLALTLSQIEKDPVTLELIIAAQFDTGHYQRIALLDPQGDPIQQRVFQGDSDTGIPNWFRRYAHLSIEPGVAQVQDGWFQFGTLYVESHSRFAYQALWTTTRDLFIWFLIVSLAAGSLGSLILKYITRPLDDVVSQAEAIGGRRFITSKEPRTLEFGRVVRAMNILSDRVRQMLDSERQRLEEMRYKNQHDALTGFANRDYFFSQLDALKKLDAEGQHAIILLRVRHLALLNKELGHQTTDHLLIDLSSELKSALGRLTGKYTAVEMGRLNGSDFAIFFTDVADLKQLSDELLHSMEKINAIPTYKQVELPLAAIYFKSSSTRGDIMMRLDTQLAQAELKEMTCCQISMQEQAPMRFQTADEWKAVLHQAITEERVSSELYPVVNTQQQLVHHEAMMRLELSGEVHRAGYFIPWARRLGMLPQLDLSMVIFALKQLTLQPGKVAINLSIETLKDVVTINTMLEELKRHPELTECFWFEVTERCAVQNPDVFADFCRQIKPLGCFIGVEKVGAEFAKIKRLEEIGLDYIKLDAAFLANLDENSTNLSFVRGVTTLAHSIGLLVIAEGVDETGLVPQLAALGVDGFSGPAVTQG